MDSNSYLSRVDVVLNRAADWLEGFDPDEVDFSTSDGVVTIEFPDGTKYVLNRQRAAEQVWFAAGAEAWHYNFDPESGEWRDAKDGHELFANIEDRVNKKLKS